MRGYQLLLQMSFLLLFSSPSLNGNVPFFLNLAILLNIPFFLDIPSFVVISSFLNIPLHGIYTRLSLMMAVSFLRYHQRDCLYQV